MVHTYQNFPLTKLIEKCVEREKEKEMKTKSFSHPYAFFALSIFISFFTLILPLRAESQLNQQASHDKKSRKEKVHKIDVKIGEEDNLTPPLFQGPDVGSDPFLTTTHDPFAEIQALQAHMQKLLDESLSRGLRTSAQDVLFPSRPFEPPVNIEDRGESLRVTIDIPGMKKEDIQVTLKEGVLTVSGRREGVSEERREEQGRKVYRKERFAGSFKRRISLPAPVKEETIKARYENGVLSIEALKEKASVEKGKTITVE